MEELGCIKLLDWRESSLLKKPGHGPWRRCWGKESEQTKESKKESKFYTTQDKNKKKYKKKDKYNKNNYLKV